MVRLFHNPRCSKSRQALQILEDKNETIEIVKYLDKPPTEQELKQVIELLGIDPIELVRKNEAVWKENYKNKNLTNEELIKAMVTNPKLIERPIAIKGTQAVIGRPPEKVLNLL
ncbi:MAG: arsenate reductase (glutaredoxin) [Aequorivita sp.]|nr:arsenate reductase (glutaredoxin) [Aequorivita sp.]|tara:strand:- start:468 stop:809 length:342 start_codon:yes stop_codon:yes gene_type:complete